jgi:hypothetical protein
MQSLERNGYTKKEVMDVLHSRRGPRNFRFRYDLLDKNNQFITTLKNVLSGEVSMNSLADIKRTARFSLRDDQSISVKRMKPIKPTWKKVILLTVEDNGDLKRHTFSGAWDGGASSAETIEAGVNGWVQTKIDEITTYRMIGLSNGDDGPSYTDIDFAIYPMISGNLSVYEKGTQVATIGTYKKNDILKVAVEGGRVKYYKNDILLYTSLQTPVFPLVIDTGIYSQFGTIREVLLYKETLTSGIDFLYDRIQPFVEIKMPDGHYIEFPLGIFILSSPTRKDQTNGVFRDVEAYGGLVILLNDRLESRLVIPAGTRYYAAARDILLSAGITKYNIEFTDAELKRDIEFEPGKEKLFIVNELLSQINYTPIYDDVNGVFVSAPYRSPASRSADYSYKDDELSVMYAGAEEQLDLFDIPNKWVVVCSNAEQEPLYSVYINENPNSITSTVNRGRTNVDYREVTDIANQQSLDAYVQRIAFEASQVYGKITFETGIMPMHDYSDVLELDYSPLGIKGKYSETSWTLPLSIGGKMKHEIRKVVSI